jgi:anti-sigma regulatory factor (Ser/Thr protein kinase)
MGYGFFEAIQRRNRCKEANCVERYAPDGRSDHLELIIPLNERYLTIPRLVLGDIFNKVGLDICDITSYKVALTEACRNLMYFSYRHLEPNPLRLTFRIAPQRLTISISSQGKCFCDTRVKTHPALDQQDSTQNLDLLMVGSLVDDIRTGLRVTKEECIAFIVITKSLQGPSSPCK